MVAKKKASKASKARRAPATKKKVAAKRAPKRASASAARGKRAAKRVTAPRAPAVHEPPAQLELPVEPAEQPPGALAKLKGLFARITGRGKARDDDAVPEPIPDAAPHTLKVASEDIVSVRDVGESSGPVSKPKR